MIKNIVNRPKLPITDSLYSWWDFSRPEFTAATGNPVASISFASSGSGVHLVSMTVPLSFVVSIGDTIAVKGLTGNGAVGNGTWTVTNVTVGATKTIEYRMISRDGFFVFGVGQISLVSDFVRTFDDLSGNGRGCGIPGGSRAVYPGPKINNRDSLQSLPQSNPQTNIPSCIFDDGTFGTLAQPFTICILLNSVAIDIEVYFASRDGFQLRVITLFSILALSSDGSTAYIPGVGTVGSTGLKSFVCVFDGANSKVYTNGVLQAAPGDAGAGSLNGVRLPCNNNGFQSPDAYYDSVMVYSKAFTDSEALATHNYAKYKMGF